MKENWRKQENNGMVLTAAHCVLRPLHAPGVRRRELQEGSTEGIIRDMPTIDRLKPDAQETRAEACRAGMPAMMTRSSLSKPGRSEHAFC